MYCYEVVRDPEAEAPENCYDPTGFGGAFIRSLGHRNFNPPITFFRKDAKKLWMASTSPSLVPGYFETRPVYAMIHGGVTLALQPFACRWDSCCVGHMYIPDHVKTADPDAYAQARIDTWNMYLSGDVWGYRVFCGDQEVDSCWGIYGHAEAMRMAKASRDCHVRAAQLDAVKLSHVWAD